MARGRQFFVFFVVFIMAELILPGVLFAGTITDGFEGGAINPFWTHVGPGSATLNSSVVLAGTQSVALYESQSSPFYSILTHDFGIDQQGSLSVYLEGDSLGNIYNNGCCTAAALEIWDANGNWLATVGQYPTSFPATVFNMRVQPGGQPPEVDSGDIAVATGWHLLEMNVGPGGLSMGLDGSTLYMNASITSFRTVILDAWGMPYPSGTAYFDNFSASTTDAVPEPSTGILFGVAATGMLGAWKSRRKR